MGKYNAESPTDAVKEKIYNSVARKYVQSGQGKLSDWHSRPSHYVTNLLDFMKVENPAIRANGRKWFKEFINRDMPKKDEQFDAVTLAQIKQLDVRTETQIKSGSRIGKVERRRIRAINLSYNAGARIGLGSEYLERLRIPKRASDVKKIRYAGGKIYYNGKRSTLNKVKRYLGG